MSLKMTAAFTEYGEIIGAVVYRDGPGMLGKARRALRHEIAPRQGMRMASTETLDFVQWLEDGQLAELDVGLNIVHGG